MEREIKLGFHDADEARQAIMATGATALRGRRLQEDYLLDTVDDALRSRRCVLRVRLECGKSMLTFKGPVQNSPMKLREEAETVVADGLQLLHVLEELGYHVWFRYEKYREEFAKVVHDIVGRHIAQPARGMRDISGEQNQVRPRMQRRLNEQPREPRRQPQAGDRPDTATNP